MNKLHSGFFPIASLHRDDLEELGYDASAVDDVTMAQLAKKMADAYVQTSFWLDLGTIADELGITERDN